MGSRARVVLVALLVALVAYVALSGRLPGEEPGEAGAAAVVDGYPQRIGFDRPSPALPDRPGALAATMRDNAFGAGRTVAVTSHGDLYELPPGPDVLSPDGRLLLTAAGGPDDRHLAVHDLTTGEVQVLGDLLGPARDPGRQVPYHLDEVGPAHFSPDGRTVLAGFGRRPNGYGGPAQLLDLASGTLTDLGRAAPAGFLASGEAVTVRWADPQAPGSGLEVTATDPTSHQSSTTTVALAAPWRGDPDTPLAASVSPEGTLLLVEGTAGPGEDAVLRLFSVTDATELAPRRTTSWDGCAPTWLDGDPVVPVAERGVRFSLEAGAMQVSDGGTRRLVAVHRQMQSSCLRVAPDALAAGPHRALLGTTTAFWSWYAWQLALAAVVVLLALGLALRHWDERGRRLPWRR